MANNKLLYDTVTGTVLGFDPKNIYVVDSDALVAETGDDAAEESLLSEDDYTQECAIEIGIRLSDLISPQ